MWRGLEALGAEVSGEATARLADDLKDVLAQLSSPQPLSS